MSVVIEGKLCESFGDLRKAIYPTKPVCYPEYDFPITDTQCLCACDTSATAKAMGRVSCFEEGGDPMERHFLKPEEITDKFVRDDEP